MAKLFGKLVLTFLPITPKFVIKFFAKRYVAGATMEEALAYTQDLNRRGFVATMDVLGEDVETQEQTYAYRDEYLAMIKAISETTYTDANGNEKPLQANISVKLTAFGLKMSPELCWDNLRQLLDVVKATNNFLRIDMEDPPVIQQTIDMYLKARDYYPGTVYLTGTEAKAQHGQTGAPAEASSDKPTAFRAKMRFGEGQAGVGIVVQANPKRSDQDIPQLIADQGHFRLCKGVYKAPEDALIFDYQEVRERMLKFGKMMLEADAYVGLATHDLWLIDRYEQLIKENKVSTDRFEWQALIGVPIDDTLERLVEEGHRVRYYVPYGEQWLAYGKRRLHENPDIAWKAVSATMGFGKQKRKKSKKKGKK